MYQLILGIFISKYIFFKLRNTSRGEQSLTLKVRAEMRAEVYMTK